MGLVRPGGAGFVLPLPLPLPAAALRAGLPGVRGHRAPLHRPGAAGGMLLLLLPLLRALRGPHVPEAGPADGVPAPGALRLRAAALCPPAVSVRVGKAAAGLAGGRPGQEAAIVCRSSSRHGRTKKERKRRPWGAGPAGPSSFFHTFPSREPRHGAPVPQFPCNRRGRGWGTSLWVCFFAGCECRDA